VTRPVNLFTGTPCTRLSGDGCCEAINGKAKGVSEAADVVVGCGERKETPYCRVDQANPKWGSPLLAPGRGVPRKRVGGVLDMRSEKNFRKIEVPKSYAAFAASKREFTEAHQRHGLTRCYPSRLFAECQ